MKKFYKWIKPEGHNGMVYKEGLNTDIMPFNPSGNCEPGGIYFSRDSTFAFIRYGEDLYEVTPVGEVYENPGYPKKWKAHKVKLKFVGKHSDPKVIQRLVDEGASVQADQDEALRWAAFQGYSEIISILIKAGANANTHAYADSALRSAARRGHLEVVKVLLEAGADVHVYDDSPLRSAAEEGHLEIVKLLLDAGADVHACDDSPLRNAFEEDHTEIVKLLKKHGASYLYKRGD